MTLKSPVPNVEALDSPTLVREWAALQERLEADRDAQQRIEYVLIKRMEADGATALAHDEFDVKLGYGTGQWDPARLAALREIVPQSAIDEAFVPEHDETIHVSPKWDMRKAARFGKYGKEAQEVLDRAKLPGAPRLSIKRRGAD